MPGPWASWAKGEVFAKDCKIELWDVIQAKVLTDDGRPQGDVLLRRPGPPQSPSVKALGFGDISVFEYLVFSDDYYAWWTIHGDGHPMVGR